MSVRYDSEDSVLTDYTDFHGCLASLVTAYAYGTFAASGLI